MKSSTPSATRCTAASRLTAPESTRCIVCGGVADSVCCTVSENFELTLRHGGGEIEKHVYMRRFDFAPIASGQKIGTVVFTRDGKVIYELTLYADESVRKRKPTFWVGFVKQ